MTYYSILIYAKFPIENIEKIILLWLADLLMEQFDNIVIEDIVWSKQI